MDKHLYCCQNTAQNYLDHIIPVPDDFKIDPDCLYGISKEDFIEGLKGLTVIIKEMYFDMILSPEEYGLPLVEDIEYTPFNPKAAESKKSAARLVATLKALVQCGELSNGEIIVNKKLFSEICKNKDYKVSNSAMIFKKLSDFGFAVGGFNGKSFDKNSDIFSFSYMDDNGITPVLYGFLKDKPLKDPLLSLNYYWAIKLEERPANNHQMIFAEYLSGDEREFYKRFDDCMESEGFVTGSAADYRYFSIEYVIDTKNEKRIARCHSDYGKLQIHLQLHKSDNYVEYIENLPERIKQMFRKESTCRSCRDNCWLPFHRTFEGVAYTDCGYGNYFDIPCFEPHDIEYYCQIILNEVKVQKSKKGKIRKRFCDY